MIVDFCFLDDRLCFLILVFFSVWLLFRVLKSWNAIQRMNDYLTNCSNKINSSSLDVSVSILSSTIASSSLIIITNINTSYIVYGFFIVSIVLLMVVLYNTEGFNKGILLGLTSLGIPIILETFKSLSPKFPIESQQQNLLSNPSIGITIAVFFLLFFALTQYFKPKKI